jgi:hypothetical protein
MSFYISHKTQLLGIGTAFVGQRQRPKLGIISPGVLGPTHKGSVVNINRDKTIRFQATDINVVGPFFP